MPNDNIVEISGLINVLLNTNDIKSLAEQAASMFVSEDEIDCCLDLLHRRWNEFFQLMTHEIRQQKPLSLSKTTLTETNHWIESGYEKEPIELPVPLEVLTLTADSGFLTPPEIGRLLLLSSKTIQDQVGYHFTWNCLCGSKFPALLQFQSLQPRQSFPTEWIFREFSKALPLRDSSSFSWPPLPSPKLQAQDVILVMQWYDSKVESRPSTILELSLEQTAEFLRVGQVTIPIVSKDATTALSSENQSTWTLDVQNLHQLHVKVHCVRRDTYQCCCIHETGEYTWDVVPRTRAIQTAQSILSDEYLDDVHDSRSLNVSSYPSVGHLSLGPRVPILLHHSEKDLESRLARADREPGGFELLVTVRACPKQQVIERLGTDDLPLPFDPRDNGGGNNLWHVNEFTFQLWANYSDQIFVYDSEVQSRLHAVTLLHIFDELQGWE